MDIGKTCFTLQAETLVELASTGKLSDKTMQSFLEGLLKFGGFESQKELGLGGLKFITDDIFAALVDQLEKFGLAEKLTRLNIQSTSVTPMALAANLGRLPNVGLLDLGSSGEDIDWSVVKPMLAKRNKRLTLYFPGVRFEISVHPSDKVFTDRPAMSTTVHKHESEYAPGPCSHPLSRGPELHEQVGRIEKLGFADCVTGLSIVGEMCRKRINPVASAQEVEATIAKFPELRYLHLNCALGQTQEKREAYIGALCPSICKLRDFHYINVMQDTAEQPRQQWQYFFGDICDTPSFGEKAHE